MSSGAYALYVDAQAGGGPNPPIDRIVPLPHGSRDSVRPPQAHTFLR
jgi:hypothetical protein